MLYIKATKTSLYKLVKAKMQTIPWLSIPRKSKDTAFWKSQRRYDYFLEWTDTEYRYQVYLATVGGSPLLAVERWERWNTEKHHDREVIRLYLRELQEAGMLGWVNGGTMQEIGKSNGIEAKKIPQEIPADMEGR